MNDSFSKCIADICGLELATLAGNYKYSVFGGHTVVIEGHKGIAEYSETQVSFLLGKSKLTVLGEKLSITCLERNFAVISGKIISVGVSNEK